jgi:chromosome segregation ATPase
MVYRRVRTGRNFLTNRRENSMTDTNKLEIEKEALIIYADRLKMQVFEKQFEIDKAYKVIDEVQEQRERALEQINGYLDKIQELNIKNDQLEKELLSLHKTLESTESELAKVRNVKDTLLEEKKNSLLDGGVKF